MSAVENVTAASKLRRDKLLVEEELKEHRTDYKRRMEAVKARDEALKQDRAALQEELVKFYKYIQDNEIKRNRANKKFLAEDKAKRERRAELANKELELKSKEREKQEAKEKQEKYQKYYAYLDAVLHHGDNEEYQTPQEIIFRFKTLDDNQNVLQHRKTELEDTLARKKSNLTMRKQRNKSISVDMQNQLNELQNRLENLQKDCKTKQDDLDSSLALKSATTRTMGQVGMACQNLYERCKEEVEKLKNKTPAPGTKQQQSTTQQQSSAEDPNAPGKKKGNQKEVEKDILEQLEFIGNTYRDYEAIVKDWKESKGIKATKKEEK